MGIDPGSSVAKSGAKFLRHSPHSASAFAKATADKSLNAGYRCYNSFSSISAILSKCRSNPVLSALLPWIGIDSRTMLPGLP
jgi:hypothetical protein